jgi:hypothetical protein
VSSSFWFTLYLQKTVDNIKFYGPYTTLQWHVHGQAIQQQMPQVITQSPVSAWWNFKHRAFSDPCTALPEYFDIWCKTQTLALPPEPHNSGKNSSSTMLLIFSTYQQQCGGTYTLILPLPNHICKQGTGTFGLHKFHFVFGMWRGWILHKCSF